MINLLSAISFKQDTSTSQKYWGFNLGTRRLPEFIRFWFFFVKDSEKT
jgi:hypothetical protein